MLAATFKIFISLVYVLLPPSSVSVLTTLISCYGWQGMWWVVCRYSLQQCFGELNEFSTFPLFFLGWKLMELGLRT